jgi:alanine racemase
MESVPLEEFVRIVQGDLLFSGDAPTELELTEPVSIEHVATHSGRIRSGAAFFALPGSHGDGHQYVAMAARNGARVAVVDASRIDDRARSSGIPLVVVDDPLRSLQYLARWWRRSLPTRFVAIVGSNGKTITKDCLVHLLGAHLPVYGTPGSYNSQLGVALAILDCPPTATMAVIEVAVSDPGEMAHMARMVEPDDVVVTNVGTRWRYRFSGRPQQIGELLKIAVDLPNDGSVLLGECDTDLRAAADAVAERVEVHGLSPELPRFGRRRRGPGVADVDISFPDEETAVLAVHTPSDEILNDVELAISAAWLLGVDSQGIVAGLADYTPTSTRMEIWRSPTGVTFVRDIATPDPMAVSSALRAAKRLTRDGGRTVVVLGLPATVWDRQVAVDLASVLIAEKADEVVGVRGGPATAGLVVAELADVIPVRLFDSVADVRTYLLGHLGTGDACLVQSSPGSTIDNVSSSLVEAMAPTRLYVDLSAMGENVTTFRRLVGPSVRIMAMVKALAYGTDALAVSLGLSESGIDVLGVSGADEGVALRRAGVNLPIVVMLGTEGELDKMLRYRLIPLLYSEAMVDAASALAAIRSEPVAVHVEVDTGMHRSGLNWDDSGQATNGKTAIECLRQLASMANIRVEGLMTHLASADEPEKDAATSLQLDRFDQVVAAAHRLGLHPLCHGAATAGTIRFPAAQYDMVRIGLGLFGLHSSPATARGLLLEPVLSLVSRILQIIDVPAGEGVGYGGTYQAPPEGGRVGVVPAGYHDCIPRLFSNFGYVVVAGTRCPIIGRVSMDSMTVDLSACPAAAVGSDVLIYGRIGNSEVSLEEVSQAIGTIPYEVMARVGPRVQRILTRH